MSRPNRRAIIEGMAAALAVAPSWAQAAILHGALPWTPEHLSPPTPVSLDGWHFFTGEEAATVEALVDRLIPPEPEWPGGKDAGCAVFIDRQLAGPYGHSEGNYLAGPFHEGTKEQGQQTATTPGQHYRAALAALDRHCRDAFTGKRFFELSAEQKDSVMGQLEAGKIDLGDKPGSFFEQLIKDTQQGFLADPVYGGNRNMAAWRMIGFPGARYDYRDWVDHHNEPYPLPPVGISEHPLWKG